ncbi:MAG: hypothetical protein AAFY26_22620 [Cyanobacteria bacterium J06638_22]
MTHRLAICDIHRVSEIVGLQNPRMIFSEKGRTTTFSEKIIPSISNAEIVDAEIVDAESIPR